MQYKALPWLRICTFGLGAQSANIWRRDWNVRNAIIEVLVLRNPRTCPTPRVASVNRQKRYEGAIFVNTKDRQFLLGRFVLLKNEIKNSLQWHFKVPQ